MTTRTVLARILAPALLASCAPSYTMGTNALWSIDDLPILLHVSEDFTEEETRAIERAAQAWSDATDNQLDFFEIADQRTEDPRLRKLELYLDDDTFGIYETDKLTELDGLTRWRLWRREPGRMKNFDIFVDRQRDVAFELLVAHEMGHALGLEHIGSAPAVMTEAFGWPALYVGLHAADIDAINWLYGTDPDARGPGS